MIDPSVLWPWVRDHLAVATGRPVFLVGETQGLIDLPYLVVTPAFAAFDEHTIILRPVSLGTILLVEGMGREWRDAAAMLAAGANALRDLEPDPVATGASDFLVEAATTPGEGDADQVVVALQMFRFLATDAEV